MKETAEREIIKTEHGLVREGFHTRVWCSDCGYNYKPSHGDPTFGPKHCPDCGNYRGTLPDPWDLPKRGWEDRVVNKVTHGIPRDPQNPLERVLSYPGFGPFYRDKKTEYITSKT